LLHHPRCGRPEHRDDVLSGSERAVHQVTAVHGDQRGEHVEQRFGAAVAGLAATGQQPAADGGQLHPLAAPLQVQADAGRQ